MRHRHRIIVEGLDGSGKTTLINHLVGRFPDFYVVPGLGATADFDQVLPAILDEEDNGRTPVHDRFFYSELIYGPILRHTTRIDQQLLHNTTWFLRNTAFLIYARPHSDRLRETVAATPQMDGVAQHWSELLEQYDHTMAIERDWYGSRFLQYVWHREGEYGLVEASLMRYLRS